MATIRGHLIDLKYSIEENVTVHLFCRLDDGRVVSIRDYYRPNFFIYPKKNIDLIHLRARIARLKFDEKNQVTETKMAKKVINCQEEDFIQVFAKRPETIRKIRETIKDWDDIINYFEDDISLTRRYLLENSIVPFSMFEAEVVEHSDGYYKLVRFINKDISFADPVVISVNAAYSEDSSGSKAISAISCSSDNFDKIITWKRVPQKQEIQIVASEEELIIAFKHLIQQRKPDIILFEDWSFRMNDIFERAKKYRISMNINFDDTEPYLNPMNNRIRTLGVNEVFIKRIINNFIDFALAEKNLDNAYKAISGVVNVTAIADEDTDDNKIINLINKKSKLNYMLFNSLYSNLTELFRIIGLRAADLLNFSLSTIIEWILIKQCISTKHIVLNKKSYDESRKEHHKTKRYIPVIDPVPGVYDNIAEVDLTPIYPEIIIKNRISPDTLLCGLEEKKGSSEGILPTILSDILSRIERIEVALEKTQNENLQRRRNILVRICSYFYEYLNTPHTRWFSYEILEQINTNAKGIINSMISLTNKDNSVVFSDYNDLFVELKQENKKYLEMIKESLPETSRISIKENYKRGFFLPREETRFARKRYALLNDKGNVESHNIIRSTHPKYILECIEELMKNILINKSKTDIIELLNKKITTLMNKDVLNDDLIINSKLTKRLEEYHDKTIQQIMIKAIKKKGGSIRKGLSIRYIICDGEGSITSRARLPEDTIEKEYDAGYYLHRILLPAIEDILPLKGITPEEILEPKDQEQLNKFMK